MLPHNDDAPNPQLRERLPSYYQENERLLEPLLGAGEFVLESVHRSLSRVGAEWSLEALGDLRERWFQGGPEYTAKTMPRFPGPTPACLRTWYRKRCGFAPRLWVGFAAQVSATASPERSTLKLGSTDWPSVIVPWNSESYGHAPPPLTMTRDQLPAGTRLQIVVLSADEEKRPPYHGRVLAGELWWDSHARSTDSSTRNA